MNLIFLPGFLGAKEDWDEVRAHLNAYDSIALDLDMPTALLRQIDQVAHKEAVLIGYSMGGRMALHFQNTFPERWKAVIALGAHLGIKDEEEKSKRVKVDELWAQRLETLPFEEFLRLWYDQPLFIHLKNRSDIFHKMLEVRRQGNPQAWANLLRNFSVGRCEALLHFPPNTHFLYGAYDERYKTLYQDLPSSPIAECGHAAHVENPQGCARAIEEILAERERG